MPVIYISYGPSDGTIARLLATDLRRLGAQVALEAAEVRFAATRARVLADPVRRCAIMIVILSPTATDSELVTAEWRYALDHDIPVIPMLHHPTDLPDRLRHHRLIHCESEQYPEALRALHATLSRHGIALEPVAILTEHYKEEWLGDMKTARQAHHTRPLRDRLLVGTGVVLVVCCFVLLVAFFTAVMNPTTASDDRGLIMGVDFALAQALGWGRFVAEVIVLIIGGMLIARHVSTPTMLSISPSRTLGAIILLVAGTVALHAEETPRIELPPDKAEQMTSDERLREQSRVLAMEEGGGGGWLGHQFYMLVRFSRVPVLITALLFLSWAAGAMLLIGITPARAAAYLRERRRRIEDLRGRPRERYRKQLEVVAPDLPRRRPEVHDSDDIAAETQESAPDD